MIFHPACGKSVERFIFSWKVACPGREAMVRGRFRIAPVKLDEQEPNDLIYLADFCDCLER